MLDQEVSDLISPALRDALGASGLERLSVRSDEDHDGGPMLSLDVYLEGRGRPVDTRALMLAIAEARRLVMLAGERRFLHLRLHIPDADESVAA